MVEEKRERAEEASERSPKKAPRLDLEAAAAAEVVPECSAASPIGSSDRDSTGDSGRCHHVATVGVMDVFDLMEDKKNVLRKCQFTSCSGTWYWKEGDEDDQQGMMKCIHCHNFFCVGGTPAAPVDRDNPMGHARLHAGLLQHGVAVWCDEPTKGYCFLCARAIRLSDWTCKESAPPVVVARNQKDQRGPGDSAAKDGWGIVPSTATKDERETEPTVCEMLDDYAKKEGWGSSTAMDAWEDDDASEDDDAFGHGAGYAYGDDHVIRGMPNLGLTCYMNATLQCLFALGKLRAMIQRPDAHLGRLGMHLQELFVETSSGNAGRGNLNPRFLLKDMQDLYPTKFVIGKMEDSYEFLTLLFNSVDYEVVEQNKWHVMQGGQVFPAFGISLFRGELFETKSCQRCLHNDPAKTIEFGELLLSFPSKDPPAGSVASPPRNKSHRSPRKIRKKPFQQTDKGDEDKMQTIPEDTTLQIDSSVVKDVVHGHMQTQRNYVPQEIIEVPTKALDSIPDLFDDTEGKGESTVRASIIPEDSVTIEAKEMTYPVKVTSQDKEEAQSSDIVHDEAQHMNSRWSIEECLALFREVMQRCQKCSKVAEPIMASTNINMDVDGDETELSNRKTTEEITSETTCGEKVSASCSTANEKAEIPTDKQTDMLTAQDSQDTSTQNQVSVKQAMLDDHSVQQMEENQNEQKDGNGCAIQRHSIIKLPPILTIQFMRYNADLSKLRGHVSFNEILHLGPFMDPSSEDKDNSSYRLVGVIEHRGRRMNSGHYVAYVRGGGHQHQSSGSSSWVRISDENIKEVSLEKVLRREAYILFYERMEE